MQAAPDEAAVRSYSHGLTALAAAKRPAWRRAQDRGVRREVGAAVLLPSLSGGLASFWIGFQKIAWERRKRLPLASHRGHSPSAARLPPSPVPAFGGLNLGPSSLIPSRWGWGRAP